MINLMINLVRFIFKNKVRDRLDRLRERLFLVREVLFRILK